MTKPPATQTTSGYSAHPKGPLAIQGATPANAPPSILGSVSHTNEMPCSMSRKNSHTNAPAIAPVSATQTRNIRRLSGFVSFDADTKASKYGTEGQIDCMRRLANDLPASSARDANHELAAYCTACMHMRTAISSAHSLTPCEDAAIIVQAARIACSSPPQNGSLWPLVVLLARFLHKYVIISKQCRQTADVYKATLGRGSI